MAVVLRCPACREKFKYNVAKGFPDNCLLCGEDINNRRDDDDILCPAFLSQKSKNNDKVARDIMDGSEQRAGMAAAMAGVPVSEMNSLKITDLNDRNDTQFATKDVVNPVTQHMDAMQRQGMPVGLATPPTPRRGPPMHIPGMLLTPACVSAIECNAYCRRSGKPHFLCRSVTIRITGRRYDHDPDRQERARPFCERADRGLSGQSGHASRLLPDAEPDRRNWE